MKQLTKSLRRLAMLLCCTVLSLLNSQAQAENSTECATAAKAAVLIERSTGRVLLSHNENLPLPMASTTKVMTALLALEQGNPEDVVTVSRNAYGVPGTSIYLSEGETITLHDLLYGLMLASGNDAAVAIAEHIGGDVDTFCRLMTQRAAEIGCRDTVFVNPNGLPAQGHHTTALDLALIAREAMKQPLFREIVSTRRASIPWEGRSYHRILNNKNRLLTDYEGATGIKTGYTKAAGRCLVFGAKRNGMEVIGVVLGCSDWFDEAARLMDLGFDQYRMFTALSQGETIRRLPVINGVSQTAAVAAESTLAAPVANGCIPTLTIDLPKELPAGLPLGEAVGTAQLSLEGEVLASIPLVVGDVVGQRTYVYELERLVQLWPVGEQNIAQ